MEAGVSSKLRRQDLEASQQERRRLRNLSEETQEEGARKLDEFRAVRASYFEG